ncbi:glycosyl hydrolase [Colletotrichum tofieldiae]|uniref:Endo-1,4-beta-xylanase n=1 Tax=Colletotrichum tofieldiae TaxID=708197 RepID=A0A166WTF6_9PEZI|nr:glycosyl hydrolase [Colletotrichum tofieldiae]GKT54260.1 glycosyl hydrolase [Colletotrichum tofieldiae]GKT73983.1 glycosyl hydrolase [Colletotrichum tofieldiae]GKT95968.1 glycosyl hydrolase [Colletotrichum tofieldiae]
MVAFSNLFLGLAAVAASVGAPASQLQSDSLSPHAQRRGPHDFFLGPNHPLMIASHNVSELKAGTDYIQNYKTGGTVNFMPSGNGFSLDFNTKNDFVVGVSWKTGSTAPITHSGSFAVTSGLATLSVYGWTTDPLVEYYVIEDSVGFSQTGTKKGTVSSDGGTYTIWEAQRVNAPSIQGTKTFNQYISFRNGSRSSGRVTMANHINAWQNAGMKLGKMNIQVVAVETWNGAGSAKQTVTN